MKMVNNKKKMNEPIRSSVEFVAVFHTIFVRNKKKTDIM